MPWRRHISQATSHSSPAGVRDPLAVPLFPFTFEPFALGPFVFGPFALAPFAFGVRFSVDERFLALDFGSSAFFVGSGSGSGSGSPSSLLKDILA